MVIGIERPDYSVTEADGPLEVCAVIAEGTLEREVAITLTTFDGSAVGKALLLV